MIIVNSKRYYGIIGFIITVFTVFLWRLVDWQIIKYDYFKKCAASFRSYILKTSSVRGEILDRNGDQLAGNSIGYKLILDDFNLPKEERVDLICKIIDLLSHLNIKWNDNLPIIVEKGQYVFDESNSHAINDLKKYLNLTSDNPNDYINALAKKLNCEKLNKNLKRNVCSMYYSTRVSSVVSEEIDEKAMSIISEFNFPGFRIETSSKRYYPDGNLASHILGYLGLMSSEEYEKYKNDKYEMNEKIGKTGIEKLFEKELKGIGGKRAIQFSKDGSIISSTDLIQTKPGNSVFLTIDAKIQKAAQEALAKSVKSAARGANSGAVVALDVKTGKVLAAASYPFFDLNKYSEDKSYYNEILKDKSLPLYDRAFNGIYSPGSVFKPFILASALQDGLLNGSQETIYCGGSYSYFAGKRLRCMGVHGNSNCLRALAKSCNVFFAELGRRLGKERIVFYAEKFGISSKTGLELPEAAGTIPNVIKNQHKLGPSQAAIGQGEVCITMLQLAKIAAGIASGKNIRPRIVEKITDYSHEKVIKSFEQEEKPLDISEENLKLTRQAMREVVTNGLASDFKNYKVPVAAKTGTAENSSGEDHTTFMCYAPFDDPKIAVACIIANGKYGNNSKAVCRAVLDAYFG